MTRRFREQVYRELFASAHAEDGLSLTNKLLIVFIVVSVIFSILATEPAITSRSPRLFIHVEMLIGAVFLVEYVARIWSISERPGQDSAWKKRWRFARSPMGIIDLVVVIASLAPFLLTNAPILRILRLLRLAALMKFGRFSMALRELGRAISERRYDLFVTLALATALLLLGATALHWAEGRIQPEAFGSIPRAMWWAIITLTTVGYGDVSPVTALGKILASFVALGGIGLVAMPTGILAAAFSDAMQRHRDTLEAQRKAREKLP